MAFVHGSPFLSTLVRRAKPAGPKVFRRRKTLVRGFAAARFARFMDAAPHTSPRIRRCRPAPNPWQNTACRFPMAFVHGSPFLSTLVRRAKPAGPKVFRRRKTLVRGFAAARFARFMDAAPHMSPRIHRCRPAPNPWQNTACRPWRGRAPFGARPFRPARPNSTAPSPAGSLCSPGR